MILRVNQDYCAGCGLCMEECPSDAIHMEDGWAVIDLKKCTGCQTCVDVCPNDAIQVIYEQQPEKAALSSQGVRSPVKPVTNTVHVQPTYIEPERNRNSHGLVPIAGAAFAYMGREVLPRFIDSMLTAFENRVNRSAEHSNISIEPSRTVQNNTIGGRGRQIRCRGGRGKGKFRKGRR